MSTICARRGLWGFIAANTELPADFSYLISPYKIAPESNINGHKKKTKWSPTLKKAFYFWTNSPCQLFKKCKEIMYTDAGV